MSRYIVTRAFSQRVNGTTIPWSVGTVVDREDLIRDLLAANYPIAEVLDETDLFTCPHCGKSSSRTVQQGARELLARAKVLMPGHA